MKGSKVGAHALNIKVNLRHRQPAPREIGERLKTASRSLASVAAAVNEP